MLQPSAIESSLLSVPPMPDGIKVLLLDDNNFDRLRIRRMSSKTDLCIQLDEVGSIAQLDDAVAKSPYDLILIDYRLPVGDGLMALDHVAQNALNKGAGKIMITGDGAKDTAVQAMRNGCHDFLSKEDMTADMLRAAMLNALTTARQQQTLIAQARQNQEIIREGLIEALNDPRVHNNMAAVVQKQLGMADNALDQAMMQAAEIETLLAGFAEEDEFNFH